MSTNPKHPFDYQAPTPDQVAFMQEFTTKAKELYALIEAQPPGRELALAKTHLQQARMWFNAGLVLN